jgi:hypothetical protein
LLASKLTGPLSIFSLDEHEYLSHSDDWLEWQFAADEFEAVSAVYVWPRRWHPHRLRYSTRLIIRDASIPVARNSPATPPLASPDSLIQLEWKFCLECTIHPERNPRILKLAM